MAERSRLHVFGLMTDETLSEVFESDELSRVFHFQRWHFQNDDTQDIIHRIRSHYGILGPVSKFFSENAEIKPSFLSSFVLIDFRTIETYGLQVIDDLRREFQKTPLTVVCYNVGTTEFSLDRFAGIIDLVFDPFNHGTGQKKAFVAQVLLHFATLEKGANVRANQSVRLIGYAVIAFCVLPCIGMTSANWLSKFFEQTGPAFTFYCLFLFLLVQSVFTLAIYSKSTLCRWLALFCTVAVLVTGIVAMLNS